MVDDFDRSVFINCPFDESYAPILQAILFTVIVQGFTPRIAKESTDSAVIRLDKIRDLIVACRYSIHDLSRCQASETGEFYRLNMPFELGVDYGCRQFAGDPWTSKKILILEEKPFRYQAALSDLAGCDIEAHGGDFQKAVRKVRNWLASEAGGRTIAPRRILDLYEDFQVWHYERQLARGFSEDDIRDYPTFELLEAMREWIRSVRDPV